MDKPSAKVDETAKMNHHSMKTRSMKLLETTVEGEELNEELMQDVEEEQHIK